MYVDNSFSKKAETPKPAPFPSSFSVSTRNSALDQNARQYSTDFFSVEKLLSLNKGPHYCAGDRELSAADYVIGRHRPLHPKLALAFQGLRASAQRMSNGVSSGPLFD